MLGCGFWWSGLTAFKMSFLLRIVEDVTTISKSQSLTSVSVKDWHLESSKQNYYIISCMSNNKSNLHFTWAGSRQHSQRHLFVGHFFVTCFLSVSFFLLVRQAATPWPLCGRTIFVLLNLKLESASSNLQAPILPIVLVAICQQDRLMLFLLFRLIDVAFNTS